MNGKLFQKKSTLTVDFFKKRFEKSTEIIQKNIFVLDPQVVQHIDCGFGHRTGAAHIVFAILGRGVIFQIIVKKHLVNKAGVARPIVFGQRVRESKYHLKLGFSAASWLKTSI